MIQILVIDAVFSFDSIITAGGTAKYVEIMIAAVVMSHDHNTFYLVPPFLLLFYKHPTLKMLCTFLFGDDWH
jgi:predicted tellurium resistance membrane protein TerC